MGAQIRTCCRVISVHSSFCYYCCHVVLSGAESLMGSIRCGGEGAGLEEWFALERKAGRKGWLWSGCSACMKAAGTLVGPAVGMEPALP